MNRKGFTVLIFVLMAVVFIPALAVAAREKARSAAFAVATDEHATFLPLVKLEPSPTATPTPTPTPTPTLTPTPTPTSTSIPGQGLVADHTVVGRFEQIPDSAISAASSKRVLQVHASTGGIIDDNGLNCIQGTRPCGDLGISFPPYKYDRRNWNWPFYNSLPNVNPGWLEKVDQFKNYWVPTYRNNVDIFGMKFCYIDTWDMMGNPQYGTPSVFDYYRDNMLQLESQNPTKTFIWWTYPILRNDGGWNDNAKCSDFATINNQIRNFARANNKPLFDIAAIESHDEAGNACFTGCESECPQYGWPNPTDGHPNVLSGVRLGKAYWWLIARLSGWNGASSSRP